VLQGVRERERAQEVRVVKGEMDLVPPARRVGGLLYTAQRSANFGLVTLHPGLSYMARI
jgi:hypothetical protein